MDILTYKIISYLNHAHSWVTSEMMAVELESSVRTIKRKMPDVVLFLEKNEFEYKTIKGKGTTLCLNDQESTRLESLLSGMGVSNSSYYFVYHKIGLDFFISKHGVSFKELKSNYSAYLVTKAIYSLNENMKRYNITISHQSNDILLMLGDEKDILLFKSKFILDMLDISTVNINDDVLVTAKNFIPGMPELLKNSAIKLFPAFVLKDIKQRVDTFDQFLRYKLTIEAYTRLIIILSLFDADIERKPSEQKNENSESNNGIVHAVFGNSGNQFSVEMIDFINDYLSLSRKLINDDVLINLSDSYKSLCEEIIHQLEEKTQIIIDSESELFKFYYSHILMFIQRRGKRLDVTNPFLSMIKKDYFNIFSKVGDVLLDTLGESISDDEVSYIAMHLIGWQLISNRHKKNNVAVLCMSGIGISQVLAERLKMEFPKLSITKTLSSGNLNELELLRQGIELIISTIEIETTLIPSVIVSPLLSQSDISLVSLYIKDKPESDDDYKQERVILDKELTKNKISSVFHWGLLGSVSSVELAILDISNKMNLKDDNAVRLSEKLIAREKFGSTVISSQGLLLLHCRFEDVNRFGVFHLPSKIEYTTIDGTVLIKSFLVMVIPEDIDNPESLADMFRQISSAVVTDSQFLELILNGDSNSLFSKLMDILS